MYGWKKHSKAIMPEGKNHSSRNRFSKDEMMNGADC
jgi:hypothetical protein